MESQEEATEAPAKIADVRGAPGILLLSAKSNVLYINQRGWELVQAFYEAQVVSESRGVLPCVINEVYEELYVIAHQQLPGKDLAITEVRRRGSAMPRPILVRGLLLPRPGGGLQARVLILLEVIGREEKTARHPKEGFRLTDREEMVLEFGEKPDQ
jgi:hypothetical protein